MAIVVPAAGYPPPAAAIEQAVRALAAGQLVGVPTDTVYGLAGDPFHAGTADRLFAAKRRPRQQELPVLVDGLAQALELTMGLPDAAGRLIERWWPGALTLVVARHPGVAMDLGSDDVTVGLRCPAHPVPRALCRAHGPLATTSANLHTRPTLATPAEIAEQFGRAVALILDAGPCTGTPSTVVDCTGVEVKLLREGRIAWADIQASLD